MSEALIRTHVEAWTQLAHGALARDADGRLWTCERDGKTLTLTPVGDREGQPGCTITALGLYVLNDEPYWPLHEVKITREAEIDAEAEPAAYVRILTGYRAWYSVAPNDETQTGYAMRMIRFELVCDIINALRDAGAWPDVV